MIFRDVRIRSLAATLALLVLTMLLTGCDDPAPQLVAPTLSAQMLAISTATPPTVTKMTATASPSDRTFVPTTVPTPDQPSVPPTVTKLTATDPAPTTTPVPTPVIYPTRRSFPPYIDPRIADDYDINLSFVQDGMAITITADIVGGADSNWLMHCKRTSFNWGNDVIMTVSPDCIPYEEGMKFRRTHEFSWQYEESGDVEITFIYQDLAPVAIAVHIDKNMVWPLPTPESTDVPDEHPSSHIRLPSNHVANVLADLYWIDLHYIQSGSNVEVHTNIIGGPDSHPEMHCMDVEMRWGSEVAMIAMPDCAPYEEDDKFQRVQSFNHEFTSTGYHEIFYRYGQLYAYPIVIYVDEQSTSPGLISPEEAAKLKNGTHAHVKGMFYVDIDGKWGLCGFVFDSLPPQCHPPIRIEIPARLKPRNLESQNGVSWSAENLVFAGTMRDGVLIVER